MSTTPNRDARQAKIAAAAPERNRGRLLAGLLVALLVLGGIVFAVAQGTKSDPAAAPAATATAKADGVPATAAGMGGGYVVNADKAKPNAPTLDVYEDYQCPWCHRFHTALKSTLDEVIASGDAKVVFHMMSFLDDNSGAKYSKPAANAAACAADAGAFLKFHDTAFDNQLPEGQSVTQDQLTDWATKAGISGSALDTFKKCSADNAYGKYVASVQDAASRANVTSTPTYKVNGKDVEWSKTQDPTELMSTAPKYLKDAIAAATK